MSVRVVIADDSPFFREILREVLEETGEIEVVGEAKDGTGVLALVKAQRPALLLLDIHMPLLGGLETIEEVMASTPIPILIVTARPAKPGEVLVFEALRRGALEVLEKSVVNDRPGFLRGLVVELAKVPVVLHPRARARAARPAAAAVPALGPPSPGAGLRVIGVGASAGGPLAVAALLSSLGPGFGASLAVVQHLSPGFAQGYAAFLKGNCALPVRLVTGPTALERGVVYVAPDERHLIAEGGRLVTSAAGPWPYRPSVDALFLSLAQAFGADSGAVVLSGMGRDGVLGAEAIAGAGGPVFAQDEAGSAVFGMPRAVAEAVRGVRVAPIVEIAASLRTLAERPGG
jgi:two-component system chemotaxis response regulator CheB